MDATRHAGTVALVTGAASGIGRATAERRTASAMASEGGDGTSTWGPPSATAPSMEAPRSSVTTTPPTKR